MLDQINKEGIFEQFNVLTTSAGISYDFYSDNFYITSILAIGVYLLIILSFLIYRPIKNVQFLNSIFIWKASPSKVYNLALVLLAISFIAFLFAVIGKGGFSNWYFSHPRMYYSAHVDDNMLGDSWSLTRLMGLSSFACMLFWGLNRDEETGRYMKKVVFVLFILSLIFSGMLLFRSSGRLAFFRFLAVFVVSGMYLSKKGVLRRTAILALVGVGIVIYGRFLFKYFLYQDQVVELLKDKDSSILHSFYSFISNFTFPFFSTSNNLNFLNDKLGLFIDLIKSPLALVPFFEIDLTTSSEINTLRSVGRSSATIPSDIISYGLINGGYLGVVFVALIFGIILKLINSYAATLTTPVNVILYVFLVFNIGFRVMYFDPIHFLSGSFSYILGLVLYSFITLKLK